jgi:2-octaprenyl-6-methoxyphenol hydroxylase
LRRYTQWRRRDHARVIAFTDALVRVFSNDFTPLVVARDLGMTALDLLPGLKQGIIGRAMGIAGRLPRLARGIPL